MKKLVMFFLLVAIMMGSFTYINKYGQASQESISDKLIRFHVIANSDTTSDQALKLKVRDKVLNYLTPILKNSNSIGESRKILFESTENIQNIGEEVIRENGYQYSIQISLNQENFPVKTYGNITLPEGEYEAFKIVIGSGKGHNWWCVMFPPLCFTDVTKGEVAYKETEESMKNILTNDEYTLVNNLVDVSQKKEGQRSRIETSEINGKKVIFRFKLWEVFSDVKETVCEFFHNIFNDKDE